MRKWEEPRGHVTRFDWPHANEFAGFLHTLQRVERTTSNTRCGLFSSRCERISDLFRQNQTADRSEFHHN